MVIRTDMNSPILCSSPKHEIAWSYQEHISISSTVKEEIFLGEKFRTFLSKPVYVLYRI